MVSIKINNVDVSVRSARLFNLAKPVSHKIKKDGITFVVNLDNPCLLVVDAGVAQIDVDKGAVHTIEVAGRTIKLAQLIDNDSKIEADFYLSNVKNSLKFVGELLK